MRRNPPLHRAPTTSQHQPSRQLAALYDHRIRRTAAAHPDQAIRAQLASLVTEQLRLRGYTRAAAYEAHNAYQAGLPADPRAVDAWRRSVVVALMQLIGPIGADRR